MSDLISRQAAIDAIANCTNCGTPDELRKYVDKHSLENEWTGGVLDAMEAVEDIPAADVVPVVHGKWIPQDHNKRIGCATTAVFYYPKCSACGHNGNYDMYYCPNCGAKMDGGDEHG